MQAFFGGHCWGEHVQADGAGQLRLQGLGRDRYLCCICYRLLWRPDAKVLIMRIKLDDSHFTGSGKYNWLLGCLTWKYTCAARRGRGPMTFLRVQSSWITALFSEIYVTDICIKSCKNANHKCLIDFRFNLNEGRQFKSDLYTTACTLKSGQTKPNWKQVEFAIFSSVSSDCWHSWFSVVKFTAVKDLVWAQQISAATMNKRSTLPPNSSRPLPSFFYYQRHRSF